MFRRINSVTIWGGRSGRTARSSRTKSRPDVTEITNPSNPTQVEAPILRTDPNIAEAGRLRSAGAHRERPAAAPPSCDERAPSHSITSSARSNIDVALDVLTLWQSGFTTSSPVGCRPVNRQAWRLENFIYKQPRRKLATPRAYSDERRPCDLLLWKERQQVTRRECRRCKTRVRSGKTIKAPACAR
jgi:hypothetical protein